MQRFRKNINSTGGTLFLLLVVLGLFSLKSLPDSDKTHSPPVKDSRFVEVAGHVPSPRVIRSSTPVTLRDLIEQVGLNEETCIFSGSDLKTVIASGTRVCFTDTPQGYTATLETMPAFHKMTLGMPLHLNGTSEAGLTAISGIGPGLAALIVRERAKRGGFKNLDELIQIQGINKKLLEKIRPFLEL